VPFAVVVVAEVLLSAEAFSGCADLLISLICVSLNFNGMEELMTYGIPFLKTLSVVVV
jgi:hypothetical protein